MSDDTTLCVVGLSTAHDRRFVTEPTNSETFMTRSVRSILAAVVGLVGSALFASVAAAQVVHPATPKDDYKAEAKAEKYAYKAEAQSMKAQAKSSTKYSAKAQKAIMKRDSEETKAEMKNGKSEYLETKANAKAEKTRAKLERKAPPLN